MGLDTHWQGLTWDEYHRAIICNDLETHYTKEIRGPERSVEGKISSFKRIREWRKRARYAQVVKDPPRSLRILVK